MPKSGIYKEFIPKYERKDYKRRTNIVLLSLLIVIIYVMVQADNLKKETIRSENEALTFKKEYCKENSLLQKEISLLGVRPSSYKRIKNKY